MYKQSEVIDIAGIGIGPFNLSLAALLNSNTLKKLKSFTYSFFDKKMEFSWHHDMLLENAKLQVHFLKDLASCVDPSNPYTFLAYLVAHGRIYNFLNCKQTTVSRQEFNDYYRWVSKQINNLNFDENVVDILYQRGMFEILTDHRKVYARNLVLGVGATAYIHKKFNKFLCNSFFHNSQFISHIKDISFASKRVAVIGSGQSGAEVFDTLISINTRPEEIIWVTNKPNFESMENCCFANEYYTPSYINYFYNLPSHIRQNKLSEQRLTSDGISQEFADDIYRKLYQLKYLNHEKFSFNLICNHELYQVEKCGEQYLISLVDKDSKKLTNHTVDIVILATGYQSYLPKCVQNVLPHIKNTNELIINFDYSIDWEYKDTNKIFIQNGAKHTHGISDPNLSLSAWRNAVIINSLMETQIFNINMEENLISNHTIMALKNQNTPIKILGKSYV